MGVFNESYTSHVTYDSQAGQYAGFTESIKRTAKASGSKQL